jgi:hypothetical protein
MWLGTAILPKVGVPTPSWSWKKDWCAQSQETEKLRRKLDTVFCPYTCVSWYVCRRRIFLRSMCHWSFNWQWLQHVYITWHAGLRYFLMIGIFITAIDMFCCLEGEDLQTHVLSCLICIHALLSARNAWFGWGYQFEHPNKNWIRENFMLCAICLAWVEGAWVWTSNVKVSLQGT